MGGKYIIAISICALIITGVSVGWANSVRSKEGEVRKADGTPVLSTRLVELPDEGADAHICGLDAVECENERSAQNLTPRTPNLTLPRVGYTRSAIVAMIEQKASIYGVNVNTALKIAECESNISQYAKSPTSSAKGIYQFLDARWTESCEGDVLNAEDNVECFMKNFNQHPGWWEPSATCWK